MRFRSLHAPVCRVAARVPVTLAIASVALAVVSIPALADMLQFDRGLIQAGEPWRLATCHLTHWNLEHFQWDFLMFVVLGVICELRQPRQMRLCVFLAAASVSGIVLVAFPNITSYRGLSGIDTALFMLLACSLLNDARRQNNIVLAIMTSVLLLAFALKTTFEATTNQAIFVEQTVAGFRLLVWDHVVAALVGAGVALSSEFLARANDIIQERVATQCQFDWE